MSGSIENRVPRILPILIGEWGYRARKLEGALIGFFFFHLIEILHIARNSRVEEFKIIPNFRVK